MFNGFDEKFKVFVREVLSEGLVVEDSSGKKFKEEHLDELSEEIKKEVFPSVAEAVICSFKDRFIKEE